MSSSGGGVRFRVDGRWEGRYYSADGRRRSVFGKTKREAQEKLRAALIAADHGIRPVAGRATVAEWLDEWLATSVEPRCRPRTVDSYRDTARLYIVPTLGRIPLVKLEPEDVQRMIATLKARGDLSETTIRYAYAVLRIALGRALKSGRVMRNVATLVDAPGKTRRELHPLSAAEARYLLAGSAGDRYGALFAMAIATGMRQGELFGLRWSDVDLDAGMLAVRHTLRRSTRDLAEPKTERARRTLRLGVSVVATLREHRRRQLEDRMAAGSRWHDGGYVFAATNGAPLDSQNVTHALQATLARLGLPRQRFHDLRHAYATLMLEDGEELAILSRTLGHADLSTTADVYAHLTPAMVERSAARMDAILRPRSEVG